MAIHDHNKTGSSTLFMLGVAGMGLAIAMFFDARNPRPVRAGASAAQQQPVQSKPEPVPEHVPVPDTPQPQEGDTNVIVAALPPDSVIGTATTVLDDSSVLEATLDTASTESKKTNRSKVSMVPEDKAEQEQGEMLTYREMFLAAKTKEERELIDASPDHSYTGDGSKWSKRMYFIKEAYRRSREATPVDPVIKARVKYKHKAMKAMKQK